MVPDIKTTGVLNAIIKGILVCAILRLIGKLPAARPLPSKIVW